jgi:hypothetical protein
VHPQTNSSVALAGSAMRFFFLIFLPFTLFAQPKKGFLAGRQTSLIVNDSTLVWQQDKSYEARFFIGDRTLTIRNTQYSIDSARITDTEVTRFYTFFLSLRGRRYRCYVFPVGGRDNWQLLFDDYQNLVLYHIREE